MPGAADAARAGHVRVQGGGRLHLPLVAAVGEDRGLLPAKEDHARIDRQLDRRPAAAGGAEDVARAAARGVHDARGVRSARCDPEARPFLPLHVARFRGAQDGLEAAAAVPPLPRVQRAAQRGGARGAPDLDPQAAGGLQPGRHPHVLPRHRRHRERQRHRRVAHAARARGDVGAARVPDEPDDLPGAQV